MAFEVLIYMKNPNALIAIAHFSENSQNPYSVFCEFVKYSLSQFNKDTVTITEISTDVESEFGIKMPIHILSRCLEILEKDSFIEKQDDLFRRIGMFDSERFNEMRAAYRQQEDSLVRALVTFVNRYSLVWDYDTARTNLIAVLDGEHLAYDIRLQNTRGKSKKDNLLNEAAEIDLNDLNTVDVDSDDSLSDEEIQGQPMFPARIFVGKFLLEALQKEDSIRDYLLRVCEGILVCTGAYQLTGDENYTKKPYINGTGFFFDTRLLLRCVGCAGEAAVESAQELRAMIQKNGGHIYYFDHTWDEIETALEKAQKSLERGNAPVDYEMRLYALHIKNDPTVLSAKLSGLKRELEAQGIFLRTPEVYDDRERLRISFDENDFKHFLKQNHWRDAVAEKDAASVWNVHMRRSGRYDAFYGTNDHLCVLVTTTTKLARMTLAYQREHPSVKSISSWRRKHQPVITDTQLMCRIWSPEVDTERISLLKLTANAVAAQRPTKKYFDEMSRLVGELKTQIPEASGICLSEFFSDKMTESILELVGDNEERFDLGTLSSSFAEITEAKAIREAEKTKAVEAERDDLQYQLNEQTNQIINAAKQRLHSLPFLLSAIGKTLLWLDVIVGVLTIILSGICALSTQSLNPFWALIIPAFWLLLDRVLCKDIIRKRIIRKWLPTAKQKYAFHISRHLSAAEQPYKDRIISECSSENRVLIQCQQCL